MVIDPSNSPTTQHTASSLHIMPSIFLTTFIALALGAILFAFLRRRMKAKNLAASANNTTTSSVPVVKQSKYASVSNSVEYQAAKQAATSASSTQSSTNKHNLDPSPDIELDEQEQADYDAAKAQSRLEFTLLSMYQLMCTLLRQGKFEDASNLLIDDELKPHDDSQRKRQLIKIASTFPHYDCFSQSLPSLTHFTHIRQNTHCIFARKSQVAGSPPTPAGEWSVEEQTLAALPGLVDFTLKVKASYPELKELPEGTTGPTLSTTDTAESFYTADTKSLLKWSTPLNEFKLDAFVIEISGKEYCDSIESFAHTIRTVLSTISKCDVITPADSLAEANNPGGNGGFDRSLVQSLAALDSSQADEVFSSSRWHFSFLNETFFVTCFAPVYPKNHARYQFCEEYGENDEERALMESKCFVLFQPELSFLRHNLSPDTKHTNWNNPKTERDRIRIAFKQADRAYPIPDTVSYPAAHFIVPPLEPFSGKIVRWWQLDPEQGQTVTTVSSGKAIPPAKVTADAESSAASSSSSSK